MATGWLAQAVLDKQIAATGNSATLADMRPLCDPIEDSFGSAPISHEWNGTEVRLQYSDLTWGPWVDLIGPIGLNWLGSLATAPLSPNIGDAYYDTTQKKSFIWDGISWEILTIDGADGVPGADGDPGEGVPIGGTTNQVLIKNSAIDYDTSWNTHESSEDVNTTPVTITLASKDHLVFVDTNTAGGIVDLTINDATKGAFITISAEGAYKVTLTLTGLTGEEVPAAEARTYLFTGTVWVLASGGGGGGDTITYGNLGIGEVVWFPGSGPISYDKLVCDGTLYDIVDYPGLFTKLGTEHGGDGITTFGVPDLQGKVPGAEGTSVVNGRTKGDATAIGGVREDQIQGHYHDTIFVDGDYSGSTGGNGIAGTNKAGVAYDLKAYVDIGSPSTDGVNGTPRTGEYTRPTELVGRWLIQAFDTVQEVPADPSLIKDWVEKFGPNLDTPSTPAASVLNSWGVGKYKIQVKDFVATADASFDIEIQESDISSGHLVYSSIFTPSASYVGIVFNQTANTFSVYNSTYTGLISKIQRWEDVAGADAQLSVPVDGWETVYDEPAGIDISIVNSWGIGSYEFIGYSTNTGRHYSYFLTLDSLTQDGLGTITLEGDASGSGQEHSQITYDQLTNSFTSHLNWAGSIYIRRIRKFNSLINVVHSYKPEIKELGLQIPQPKTFVEKWNDGGAGNITSKLNEWDPGVFLIQGTSFNFSAVITEPFTQILKLDNLTESRHGVYAGNAAGELWLKYDHTDNTFKFTTAGSYYITSISRLEADPDNLPLQTIPADPSLVKDWVSKYYDYTGTLTAITNNWGNGSYKIVGRRSTTPFLTITWYLTVTDSGVDYHHANYGYLDAYAEFLVSTNTFSITGGGTTHYFCEISRWEDAVGSDVQLDPPNAGWTDLSFTPGVTVTNTWGPGKYEVYVDGFAGLTEHFVGEITIPEDYGPTDKIYSGGITNVTASTISLYYDAATNLFTQWIVGTYSNGTITRIRKATGLVNVLHSYVPDPRSVAQKDWVEVYKNWANTSNQLTLKQPDGLYKVTCVNGGALGTAYTANLILDSVGGSTTPTETYGALNSNSRLSYVYATGVWQSADVSFDIVEIKRWQDSQASDAPRNVLEDGWETLWEDYTSTSQTKTLSVADGVYEVQLQNATPNLATAIITVRNAVSACSGPWDPGYSVAYTTATGVWDSTLTSWNIVRIRKFTGLLRIYSQVVTNISEGSNITNAVIDTDAGDVDCTSYFADTTQDRVVKLTNDGTNGNHLTNCPNSIEIGDRKTVQFYYNLGWRYEDVKIDEYSTVATISNTNGVSTAYVKKWAGGEMQIRYKVVSTGNSGNKTVTHPETWVGDYETTGGIGGNGSNAGRSVINRIDLDPWDVLQLITDSGAASGSDFRVTYEGRWKTGE